MYFDVVISPWEIGTSILAEELESRPVISKGSVEFVSERAEEESFAVDGDSSTPFACGFDEVNAFETGGGFAVSFAGVLLVGRIGGEAEIGAAVVEAIVVMVVNEKVVGRIHKPTVHPDYAGLEERAARDGAEGIVCAIGAVQPPFMFAKEVVIGGVNDGEPEFLDVDKAGGMAITQAVINKNNPEAQPREAIWNRYCKFSRHNFLPFLRNPHI